MPLTTAQRAEKARELRWKLITLLGAACAICGSDEALEIDHRDGRSYDVRKMGRYDRAKRYWSEYLAGVRLRVLCKTHNAGDGNTKRRSRR